MIDFAAAGPFTPLVRNLCRNPALRVDGTFWQAILPSSTGTVSTTGGPLPGTGYFRVSATTASSTGANGNIGGSASIAGQHHALLTAGTTYLVSGYVRPSYDVWLKADISWRNASGNQISRNYGDATLCPAGEWTRLHVIATAPANTVGGGFRVVPSQATSWDAGTTWDMSCVLIAETAELLAYFDGAYSPLPDFDVVWNGSDDLTTSDMGYYSIIGVTGGRQNHAWDEGGVCLYVPAMEQASFVVDEWPVSIRARYAGQSLAVGGVTFTAPTDGASLIVDRAGTWVLGSGYWDSPRPVAHPTPTAPTRHEILTGHRSQALRFELLDRRGGVVGELSGVNPGGSLSWTGNQAVKGRGTLSYTDDGQNVDWLTCRIRISATVQDVEGAGEPVTIPLGVWVPSIPAWSHDDTGRRASVTLLSRERILARQAFPEAFSLPAGTNIVQAIRDIITGAGESAGALTDSDKTLAVDRVWPAGTTRLQVINDLATAGGFMSLFSDGLGQFRLVPDVRPSSRPLSWRFQGEDALYVPAFSREQDVDAIPNVFMATARGSDDENPLTAIARNDDPSSPFSTVNRGEVWADVESIDAADQGVLDAYASRRLMELSGASAFVEIDTALLPFWVNDAVWFTSHAHSIDARFVISTMTVHLSDVGLANLRLREVVDA